MDEIKLKPYQRFYWLDKSGSYLIYMTCISIEVLPSGRVVYTIRSNPKHGTTSVCGNSEVYTTIDEFLEVSKAMMERKIGLLQSYIDEIDNTDTSVLKAKPYLANRNTFSRPIMVYASENYYLLD